MVAEAIEPAGGAEEYLSAVVGGLLEAGHVVRVFYRRPLVDLRSVSANLRSVSRCLNGFDRRDFFKELELLKPDVVNFQNIIDRKLLWLTSRRVSTTVFLHNHESYCPGNSKYFFNSSKICQLPVSICCAVNAYRERCMTRKPLQLIDRIRRRYLDLKVLKSLPAIIVNSNFLKVNLVANGVPDDLIVINQLFPPPFPKEISGLDQRLNGQVPIILFVGRLFREKGVADLLQALALIKTDYQAVIVGEGWDKERLISLAHDLGIFDKVRFTGFLDRGSLAPLYRRARLLVMPSLWPEPFGLVGLEAYSFGLPVVAYKSGGIPEWLSDGKTGFAVEVGAVSTLAGKILQLIERPGLGRDLGDKARGVAVSLFTLERHLETLLGVYQRLK